MKVAPIVALVQHLERTGAGQHVVTVLELVALAERAPADPQARARALSAERQRRCRLRKKACR